MNRCQQMSVALVIAWALLPSGLLPAQVRLDLHVLRMGAGGEQPEAGTKVWLIPSSGEFELETTDGNGRVQFSFVPTAYVKVLVGTPPDALELPQMSGRFDQRTSVFRGGLAAYVYGDAAAPSVPGAAEIDRFLRDIKARRGGEALSQPMRQELEGMRKNIDQVTREQANDSPELRKKRAETRRELTGLLEEVLSAPWKLGVVCDYTDGGALVRRVVPDSPAARAGIRPGAYITEVDGVKMGQVGGRLSMLPEAFARSTSGRVRLLVNYRSGMASSIQSVEVQLTR